MTPESEAEPDAVTSTRRPVVRTVLGDIDPGDLGFCHAHDHLLIGAGIGTAANPDLLIDDVDAAAEEVRLFAAAGGRAIVDAMPLDCGRDAAGLVEISRRTSVHVIATTGFHTRHYYEPGHWSERLPLDTVLEVLTDEVTVGLDRHGHGGPTVERLDARAGLVKAATDDNGFDARAERVFTLAAECHHRTGVPVITHTERGAFALEQVEYLTGLGVPPDAILVSHVDRRIDTGYHRDLAATGAYLVYDGPSRHKYHTPEQVAASMAAARDAGGLERILIGMDLALRSYRVSTGGSPGLAYVLDEFLAVLKANGFNSDEVDRIGRANPARALSLRPV